MASLWEKLFGTPKSRAQPWAQRGITQRANNASAARYSGYAKAFQGAASTRTPATSSGGGQVNSAPYVAPAAQSGWGNTGGWGGGGGGGGDGGAAARAAAAQAAANKAAKDQSIKQNAATRAGAEAKAKLFASFDKQLATKTGNADRIRASGDSTLLKGYGDALTGLRGTREDNEKSEADASYGNFVNALRERSDIMQEVASQGAGETDLLRANVNALRNWDANQQEVNRSFFDTQRANIRALDSLNTDTITGRKNLWDKMEDAREAAYSDYYNQRSDTFTEIYNIENANTNIDSDTSVAYKKKYTNAAADAAKAAAGSYKKRAFGDDLRDWTGKTVFDERTLNSNKAQVVNLGGPMKRPEGATLRKW